YAANLHAPDRPVEMDRPSDRLVFERARQRPADHLLRHPAVALYESVSRHGLGGSILLCGDRPPAFTPRAGADSAGRPVIQCRGGPESGSLAGALAAGR